MYAVLIGENKKKIGVTYGLLPFCGLFSVLHF